MSDTPMLPPAPPVPNRRKPTAVGAAIKGSRDAFSMSFGLGTAHYLLKCFDAQGHFHWIRPEDALLELWLPGILVPMRLIWQIFTNRLEQLAGEEDA